MFSCSIIMIVSLWAVTLNLSTKWERKENMSGWTKAYTCWPLQINIGVKQLLSEAGLVSPNHMTKYKKPNKMPDK